ncbi:hypothetical protein U1Q18_041818 [Sarracenia purpurea var. burkii]
MIPAPLARSGTSTSSSPSPSPSTIPSSPSKSSTPNPPKRPSPSLVPSESLSRTWWTQTIPIDSDLSSSGAPLAYHTHLYREGGRAFWIHNTGPIGCLPATAVNVHNPKPGYVDEHGCVKGQNGIAVEFNKKLEVKVVQLRAELKQATLTYVDIYAAKPLGLVAVISEPSN